MKVFFEDLNVSTRNRTELIDVTRNIKETLRKSEIKDGLCIVHTIHSTTALIVNENEAGPKREIIRKVQQAFPKGAGWLHDRVDDNADAHMASSFTGPTRIFPIRSGGLVRGIWQNIFLFELDGPRSRRITIEIMGE